MFQNTPIAHACPFNQKYVSLSDSCYNAKSSTPIKNPCLLRLVNRQIDDTKHQLNDI